MDINVGRRRRIKIKEESVNLSEQFPFDLQMYLKPPQDIVSLSEFQDMALDRLQFLRILERASQKGHKTLSNEWKDCVKAEVRKEELKTYEKLIKFTGKDNESQIQARKVDLNAHYILVLAYCRSEELKRWFMARELEFFKLRFSEMSFEVTKKWLAVHEMDYKPISAEEKSQVLEDLLCSTLGYPESKVEIMDFYKVYFTEVLNLIKTKKVYLHKGYAYIPSPELIQCVSNIFRAKLSERLAKACRNLPNIDDDRLDHILKNIHFSYTGNDYSSTQTDDKNSINPLNMDLYAKQNFPMCMRHIHTIFRQSHHLKHFCRLQYGLFLKGIGLIYDDAVKYFREEYTKAMDGNKFEKEYLYNIKHQYGKVGNMTNYSPYSCMKIITQTVGQQDHHGCPFAHWESHMLKHQLSEYGFSQEQVTEMVDLSSKKHCQIACGKYFEYTHGVESKNAIIHPNQYFEESYNMGKDKNEMVLSKKNKKVKTEMNSTLVSLETMEVDNSQA